MAQQPAQNTATPPTAAPKRFQEETVAKVLEKINAFQETGEIRLPQNYSPGNALKSAWLILQDTVDKDKRPVLEVCTQASIANALFEMILSGLSPLKKQCYFIAYGNELSCEESYFGDQVKAKRDANVKSFKGFAVYEGDEFAYELNETTGRTKILTHKQILANKNHEKTIGAYCIIIFNDDTTDAEIMSMIQIRQAWNQGQTRGQSPAHKNFTDQMAIKTAIGRACTRLNNTTDDAALYEKGSGDVDRPAAQVSKEITQGANKTAITMGTPPVKPKTAEKVYTQPEPEAEPETENVTEDKPPF